MIGYARLLESVVVPEPSHFALQTAHGESLQHKRKVATLVQPIHYHTIPESLIEVLCVHVQIKFCIIRFQCLSKPSILHRHERL